jgi:DNA-binding transcriptional regulator YiaG
MVRIAVVNTAHSFSVNFVRGSVAILYADHRESADHDHVLADLADRFEAVESERLCLPRRPGRRVARWRRSRPRLSGGLSHWHRLADAIRAEPWGPVARRVEEVLAYSRPYGVAAVFERTISRSREAAEAAERQAVAAEISRLVRESGLSRAEFASRLGTSPSRLSTYVSGKVTPSAALLVRMRGLAGL